MKKVLPMLALRGKYIFPNTVIHFDVSRAKSLRAIEEAMQNDQMIFLNNQINPTLEDPLSRDLYEVGTLAKIRQVVKLPQNMTRVFAEGLFRGNITEYCEEEPSFRVEVDYWDIREESFEALEKEAYLRCVKESFEKYCEEFPKIDDNIVNYVLMQEDLTAILDQIATHLSFSLEAKQEILETKDLKDRCEKMLLILEDEIDLLEVRNRIQDKVRKSVDKNQRDFMLREQMKAIREELGETSVVDEGEEYLQRVEKLDASEEVKEKIKKEISRFQAMGNHAAESGVIRTYIETMLDMPWNHKTQDNDDLEEAQKILNEDHYGLEKVKERVLEYLAARALSGKKEVAILCLVGPPGTGKTSIARSIARATHKEYVRISLGGVRDEAEIRGHRRTYVGAMPGRIVTAIKEAKTSNPLMLLDEVDKVGKDQRGDTASALLEVLDGEQNISFKDHYLEVPLDLSEVLFLTTANDLSTIPKPLLDRMEVIEVSSYTENEKFHIAQNYLIEKQRKIAGLKSKQITWKDEAIHVLIQNYTREAGVRNLERRIGQICRKVAKDIYMKKKKQATISAKMVGKYLGTSPYGNEEESLDDQIGLVHGLAWTSVGGTTLNIEVNVMPGKGKLQVTGSLGDVMKESAYAAISYIRSQSKKYNISDNFFETHDLHIHVPEGAVPKDGPSAGITMTTAVLSAILEQKVDGHLAMTGEVTIRGQVLPIGGLKEKLLAAKRIGIKKVVVPQANEKDVKEFDTEITQGMKIHYVKQVDQVIEQAFK
ncbi:MAG: endopeptidase La [Anaerostipes sp.]|jgi:ATP-dependent Lon protease